MTLPVLHADNLNICYQINKNWLAAVREFCITVQPGQVYGIVGESGSGKSTVAAGLMRFLAANGRIEAGSSITFMGQDITQHKREHMRALWARRMKLVPQNPAAALNPSVKVGAQVAEVLAHHPTAQQSVIDMFQRVQLADAANVAQRYPHELSGGMQQRVMIAMALITEPELLILDEPTTGLDVTTEAVILDLIRQLIAERDTGVIYVTHNLGVVAQLCQRVSVMYAGEIMADGAVEDVFTNPLHPYTIGLLNAIPRLGQTKDESTLQTINGHPPSLQDLPPGCVFADRCVAALEKCHTEKPALERIDDTDRLVRCHRWRELANGDLTIMGTAAPANKNARPLTEGEPLLQVAGLTKHFAVPRGLIDWLQGTTPAPIRAVDGVNLNVQKGRTLGLVGESGSGKTTLSRIIIGLEDRSSGSINLLGMDIRNHVRQRSPDVLARMQMVFQNPQNSLNPYLTIGQAIRRPLMKLRGMPRAQADAETLRLLEAVSLRPEYAHRYPGELSGGEKQRVVIARAFASDPALVICDEPVSALDVSVQSAVLNLLGQLQTENDTAYLFISHDLAVVGYLADYLAVMYLGQLFEVGYGHDLFHPPYHPYTEALISAIPIPDPTHQTQRVLLHDDIPSARNLPQGCRFHTRCPHKLGALCEEQEPPWRDDGDGHFIRCHIPLEELSTLQQPKESSETYG